MEKKMWTAPRVEVVSFAANDYITTCWNGNTRLFKFVCNATSWLAGLNLSSGKLYAEGGVDLNEQNRTDLFYTAPAFVNNWFGNYQPGTDYNDYYRDSYIGSDQILSGSWGNHNCGNSSEYQEFFVDSSEVHDGWLYSGLPGNEHENATSVFIWHGENGDELHAMLTPNFDTQLEAGRS